MPFSYPDSPHVRIHGPSGYAHYKQYRPWLRDEFKFRCIYCLIREQWGLVRGTFDIDHFLSQSHFKDTEKDYDNLLYSCATCNTAKADQDVPDPCRHMLSANLVLSEDGHMRGLTREASEVIEKLGLDSEEYREFRCLWIGIVQLAKKHDPDLYQNLMRYPAKLPNLKRLHPPNNSRPEGLERSCFELRKKGKLTITY